MVENNILDGGLRAVSFNGSWEVLCDKRYQGILEALRAVHLKKCFRGHIILEAVAEI